MANAQDFLNVSIDASFLIAVVYFGTELIMFLADKWDGLGEVTAVAIAFEGGEGAETTEPDHELEEWSLLPVEGGDATDLPTWDEELEELSETPVEVEPEAEYEAIAPAVPQVVCTVELPQTRDGLRAIAKERQIPRWSRLSKDELMEAILQVA